MFEKIDYPNTPRAAIDNLPPCIKYLFNQRAPETCFRGNPINACKVALACIRSIYDTMDGKIFDSMARRLARRQGLQNEDDIFKIRDKLGSGVFKCDLITKEAAALHVDDCEYHTNPIKYGRLIDILPHDDNPQVVEVTWTELTINTIPSHVYAWCEKGCWEDIVKIDREISLKMVGGIKKCEEIRLVKELQLVCPVCKKKKIRIEPSTHQDVIKLSIKDIDNNMETWEHEVEQAYPCYIFCKDKKHQRELLQKIESANKLKLKLKLMVKNTQFNTGRKVFECMELFETDKRFSYTVITEEMMTNFRHRLNGTYDDNLELMMNTVAPWLGGRDFEKELFLIWCFSAPDDPMFIAFIGDSRVGKSDIFNAGLSFISRYESVSDNKAADCDVVLQGENIKRTVFYEHKRDSESGEWKLLKGKALRAIHGRLFIDSVTEANKEIIGILREALPQGKMIIGGAGTTGQTMTVDFVTRYGVTWNLEEEFSNYPHRYAAWKSGMPGAFTYFDLKRFTLVVPFGQDDVPSTMMVSAYNKYMDGDVIGLSPEDFKMLKIFCDGLNSEKNYIWEDGVQDIINQIYVSRKNRFEMSYIQPYSNDLLVHLRKMIKGIAFIDFKLDADQQIYIKERHARQLEKLLDEYERRWEFDLMLIEEGQFRQTVSSMYIAVKNMKKKAKLKYRLYSEIARHNGRGFSDLCKVFSESENTIFTNINVLIREELITRPSGGVYKLTTLGREVYKKILNDLRSFMKEDEISTTTEDLNMVVEAIHKCPVDADGYVPFDQLTLMCQIGTSELYRIIQVLIEKGTVESPDVGKYILV